MTKKLDLNKDTLIDNFDKEKKLGELDFLKSNIRSLLDDMETFPIHTFLIHCSQ
jgi:hypothetical protein